MCDFGVRVAAVGGLGREVLTPEYSAGATKTFIAMPPFAATAQAFDYVKSILWRLTFEVSGVPKARPLDRRVGRAERYD